MNGIIKENNIESKIYEIRGIQVMIDSDLAKLYQCTNGTKDINKAVKRNINKFPNDIYFQITTKEFDNLKFQNGTASVKEHGGVRKLPYVFTEEGVAMLATVLHTKIANEMSLKIIRAFVSMRRYISNNLIEQSFINNLVLKNDERLSLVENTLNKLNEKQKINTIFYKGQIFDAYYVLKEICERAKKEIIIIDNYAGKELFNLLKDINKNIIVVTSNINEVDYEKYKQQYKNITIKKSNNFHDRFIIVDKKELYHCGSSFKDLGIKCFAINKIERESEIYNIIEEIDK